MDGDPSAVVRVGSLGKTVWGGLRVGWIRAEVDLVRRLVAARPAQDLGTPEFEQAVAAAVLPQSLDVIVAQRSHLLREGRDAAIGALARDAAAVAGARRPRRGVALGRVWTRRSVRPS